MMLQKKLTQIENQRFSQHLGVLIIYKVCF